MLSQNQMVRKVIESTYIGKCTVIEHKKTVNANHTTSLNDEIVYKDVPCRLSFKTANPTAQSDSVNAVAQIIKLFLPPDYSISPGSKLVVTQNGLLLSTKTQGNRLYMIRTKKLNLNYLRSGHNELRYQRL